MNHLDYLMDESVHSWIFRSLMVEGDSNFSTVFGSNGYWNKVVSFPNDCPEKMSRINDVDLLKFFRSSGIALKFAGIYDNPIDYINRVKRVFSPSDDFYQKNNDGLIPIRFCCYCISEAIKEYGFGYLKWQWLYEQKCSKHNSNLFSLKSSNRQITASNLSKVLAGHKVEKNELMPKKISDDKKENYEGYHIMPCFLVDFYSWATFIRADHSLGRGFYDWYYQDGRRKPISRKCLHYILESYVEKFPEECHRFFMERSEVKEVRFGINQPASFCEKLLKSKKYDCSCCTKWKAFGECPAKPIKVVSLIPTHKKTIYWKNPCDFLLKYGVSYYD